MMQDAGCTIHDERRIHDSLFKPASCILHLVSCILTFVLFMVAHYISNPLVFAAEEATHNGGAGQWLWPIVNFTILVVVLFVFLKKPLQTFFKQRTEMIEKTLNEAKGAKEIAEKALKEVEQKLKLKDEEIERIITSASQAGEKERERLTEEGKVMSKRIKEQAEGNIDYELKKAKEELKAEAVEIAMELAEKKLKDKLTKERQQKLLEEAVSKLGLLSKGKKQDLDEDRRQTTENRKTV